MRVVRLCMYAYLGLQLMNIAGKNLIFAMVSATLKLRLCCADTVGPYYITHSENLFDTYSMFEQDSSHSMKITPCKHRRTVLVTIINGGKMEH